MFPVLFQMWELKLRLKPAGHDPVAAGLRGLKLCSDLSGAERGVKIQQKTNGKKCGPRTEP